MDCFVGMERFGMEELVFCSDRQTGLKAIIAVHDTTLGPAMGGTRMKAYSSEDEALEDVSALARAMTYKASMAGLDFGGGKAVIIGDPAEMKDETLLRAYGRFVQRLGGRYITAVDSGINEFDIDCIRRETGFALGGSAAGGRGGCPSPATAYGVWQGIRACAQTVFGSPELKGRVIAVQGLGSVGRVLCQHLAGEGASLVVTDIDADRGKAFAIQVGAGWVEPEEIHKVHCDIFAPCALGGVVKKETLPELDCRILAGATNNVLADHALCDELHRMGILYAPDYVINAGGLIYIAYERTPYLPKEIMKIVGQIGERLLLVMERAAKEDASPLWVANRMAEERITAVRELLALRSGF
ncbi:MAG: Glu/Leu/Phe/Val dehydrogenase dimerization domain-containing protein [Bacillota bacterium]|nr:Glu/Leu/Phe/Val dehydrogenase dimerization domain-containing protein [Bacillota bacterium]MDW7682883.1 Glu/Leu/Phe/Val dehydrogenase dimerization domain-containing protein [Bacillota bacterium]